MQNKPAERKKIDREVDVVVVGAGFAGLYALYRARRDGLSAIAVEAGSGVGGTWYWNRYPGARCDVESLQYSYSFDPALEQEWKWSERYAAQSEILAYINHVADRHDFRRDILFDTRVTAAEFDESQNNWSIGTDADDSIKARFCVMATGNLSASRVPPIPGLHDFTGEVYHTGEWPRGGVDFAGKRVAVIGTGSSGIQLIPQVAQVADHLTVFQRTPAFSVPARNKPLDPTDDEAWKREYPFHRDRARQSRSGLLVTPGTNKVLAEASEEERLSTFEYHWKEGGPGIMAAFTDLMVDPVSNAVLADFVRDKIRTIVKDPQTAEKLIPRDYPIGSKRICLDTGYFDTFNRENVTLVDIRSEPIERITASGIMTNRTSYDFDCIAFATGFDAMTGALSRITIKGQAGRTLGEKWSEGPRTYLGLMTSGFPNLFLVTGPGSPSVIGNVVLSIEFAVDWIFDSIQHMRNNGYQRITADRDAEDKWVDHVREVAYKTLYPVSNSWYLGANIPGKPRVFMPYVGGNKVYRDKVAEIIGDGYAGFCFDGQCDREASLMSQGV